MNELQEPNKMTKDQLKSLALKQRIGEITSNYEDRAADLRADFTLHIDAMQDRIAAQEAQIENLEMQLGEYQSRDLSQKKASSEKSSD